jgi:chromosome segregation ATPase
MASKGEDRSADRDVDIEEVARLIEALERDLEKVRMGSHDLQALRDEADRLRQALESRAQGEHTVRERLRGLQGAIEELERRYPRAVNASVYLAEIGRILGIG